MSMTSSRRSGRCCTQREVVSSTDPRPRLSVVVPLFNEAPNVAPLCSRLREVMRQIAGGTEIVIVDDGSTDDTLGRLRAVAAEDPSVRVIAMSRNYGQHAAVFTGLEAAAGATVVTMDGDLQNLPEDIPRLLAKAEEGYDVVGGWREHRHDGWARRAASRPFNVFMRVVGGAGGTAFRDYGCMLRAYSRPVVDAVLACEERTPYLPVLACHYAHRVAEVPVRHDDRAAAQSKYGPWGLARLCLIVGGNLLALGLLGRHVGRVYTEVRKRPRWIVAETINLNRT